MSLHNLELRRFTPPVGASFGHRHFWERAVSRRTFIAGAAAGVGGTALLAGLPMTAMAKSTSGAPRPVPGSIDVAGTHFHINLPGAGDQSTVFDFNGLVAATDTAGVGKGDFGDLTFDADMRIMEGEYIDLAGRHQHAAFGFI